ncbi:MAG: peptidoglycan-binding protein [Ignavibacteria bacterium]|nr:peptidoglycan-binding protein [Ignavibacteria bacterium]
MKYPGRVVIKGEKDKAVVRAVQQELNKQGCGPIDVDGDFGPKTFAAVKLFQRLFGESTVPINPEAQSILLKKRFWKLQRLPDRRA